MSYSGAHPYLSLLFRTHGGRWVHILTHTDTRLAVLNVLTNRVNYKTGHSFKSKSGPYSRLKLSTWFCSLFNFAKHSKKPANPDVSFFFPDQYWHRISLVLISLHDEYKKYLNCNKKTTSYQWGYGEATPVIGGKAWVWWPKFNFIILCQ